jgi:isoleucyl-tRNA synthetase
MRRPGDSPESVHLALFPTPDELIGAAPDGFASEWETLVALRRDVLNALETARQQKQIGSSTEAQVLLKASDVLEKYASLLPQWLIVSQVKLVDDDAQPIEVRRADGEKCERCWKYTTDVGADPEFPSICKPCADAVRDILNG